MSNVLTIFRKELNSYFNSPIAYLVMAFFGLIAGYFFYVYVAIFVSRSMESQMMGRGMPMDVNEWVIRPLLSNLSVIGLFHDPDDHDAPVRGGEEVRDNRTSGDIAGARYRGDHRKWLAAVVLYASGAGDLRPERRYALPVRKAGSRADSDRATSGCCCRAGHCSRSVRSFRRRRRIRSSPAFATFAVCLLLWVLDWVSSFETAAWAKVIAYMSVITHLEPFRQGRARQQRHHLLSLSDLPRAVPYGALDGIATVEGIDETRVAASRQTRYTAYVTLYIRHRHRRAWAGELAREPAQQVVRHDLEQAVHTFRSDEQGRCRPEAGRPRHVLRQDG